MKFTFDGHGINDANNEYKPRVATLTTPYKTAAVGNLLAAAPELLAIAQRLEDVLWRLADRAGDVMEWNEGGIAYEATETLRATIKLATEGTKL